MEGIIYKGIGGFYYVKSKGVVYECKARGLFRKNDEKPLAGDKCIIDITDSENKKGTIVKLLPRKNMFIRPPVCNVDRVAIVISATDNIKNTQLIDKMILLSQKGGAVPFIVLNKVDLKDSECIEYFYDVYKKSNFVTIKTSTITNDGIDELKQILKGGITLFAGNSGVGKSSLLNVIEKKFNLKVGVVSEKLGRGKHTTREVEFFDLDDGGIVVDSPGFSSIELYGIKHTELFEYFYEFSPFIGQCKFRDCVHINEKGCAVKQGVLDGHIMQSRYDSYQIFYNQLKDIKEWDK